MSWLKSKIKMVAARASDALAQAADIVAPTLYESRLDEFHHRWTTVSRFLESIMNRDLEPHEQRRLLLDSHTRDSLQKLVLLIYAEENETDRSQLTRGAHGDDHHQQQQQQQQRQQQHHNHNQDAHNESPRPCLEYLLERQLIPHLCDVGRRDQPCGIMPLAIQFIGALLSRVNHPILPTREVHVAVVALIQTASKKEVDDPVVRKCLINLLNVLWKKLRCDPVQTEFFFLHSDRTTNKGISDLVLFTGLLPHMYAAKTVGEKCREALVIAASFHEPSLCRFILKLTPFCHYAVNGIISCYDSLPKTLPDKTARPGNSASTNTAAGVAGINIDNELQSLATRLRFCCTLAMVGQYEMGPNEASAVGMATRASISCEVLALFRDRFLDGPLLDGLMHTSEATARTATLYARIILEELASCCCETSANPLLFVFVQFLVDKTLVISEKPSAKTTGGDEDGTATDMPTERRLPMELMHRMESLSSSLAIATMDLFTSLLDLQDDFVDRTLLGRAASDAVEPEDTTTASTSAPEVITRRASLASVLSPRGRHMDSAIWLASRFPDSAVAANAHIWNIQAFDSMASNVEIPVSSPNESDTSEDQIVSLLSYIADAEYMTSRRAPAVLDDAWESDDEDEDAPVAMPLSAGNGMSATAPTTPKQSRRDSEGQASSASSRTAATRNSMMPLKQVPLSISIPSYSLVATKQSGGAIMEPSFVVSSPETSVFIRLVLNRLERVLESSFYESLALSGLISTLAQKNQCSSVVFDVDEKLSSGQSIRSVLEDVHADAIRRTSRLANGHARLADIRRKLVEENNEASLNDHEPETRLLCGYVVLEEILKELCSILFAKERVKSLPVKPEGYYLEPKRFSLTNGATRAAGENGRSDASASLASLNIGQEFEQLIADAESTMGPLMPSSLDAKDELLLLPVGASEDDVDESG